MKVLVTGAAGFIDGYLVAELLEAGHEVVGVDNFSKYGRAGEVVRRPPALPVRRGRRQGRRPPAATSLRDCDQVVAAAAMIGGISYFHEFAYDLLAENERILAATFDAAIAAHRENVLERIIVDQLVDGLRVGDHLPDARGRPADLTAAGLDLRLPEAGVRVLRQGRLGAVPAAVHDPPAVQLRRHRRAAGAFATRRSCAATSSWPCRTSSRTSS